MNTLNANQQTFGIDDVLTFRRGAGGFLFADIRNAAATATICLQGAQVTHYQPVGHEPVLWMSGKSEFAAGRPIRGGIPVCWPWFGSHPDDPELPAHGFARLDEWTVTATNADRPDHTRMTLELRDNDATRRIWPHAFALTLEISVGTQLELTLTTRNTGDSAFVITQALHTYFNVSRVTDITISGFDGCPCLDTVGGVNRRGVQQGEIAIAAETDLVLFETSGRAAIRDPGFGRRISIRTAGSKSAVVWNPWIDKAKRMPDFDSEGYPGMVCVETANAIDDRRTIRPGEAHALGAVIAVERIP